MAGEGSAPLEYGRATSANRQVADRSGFHGSARWNIVGVAEQDGRLGGEQLCESVHTAASVSLTRHIAGDGNHRHHRCADDGSQTPFGVARAVEDPRSYRADSCKGQEDHARPKVGNVAGEWHTRQCDTRCLGTKGKE